ncbi:unnamed protein product [Aphanomyces euteiches]|nr:hypothetical protein AeRB84_013352 [Aphanomyces euteiches]
MSLIESAAAQVEAARASFDFYVLAQSWQPYFCTTGDFPGCDNPSDYMTTQLTIHGLWPNYNSGLYPADCGGRYPQGWTFVSNEWDKHGTCSGLTPSNYVSSTINLHKKVGTPSVISGNVGRNNVPASTIRAAYGTNYVSLICKGSNHALSEVRTCHSADLKTQIVCPSSVLNQDSCGKQTSSKVSIYSFN